MQRSEASLRRGGQLVRISRVFMKPDTIFPAVPTRSYPFFRYKRENERYFSLIKPRIVALTCIKFAHVGVWIEEYVEIKKKKQYVQSIKED